MTLGQENYQKLSHKFSLSNFSFFSKPKMGLDWSTLSIIDPSSVIDDPVDDPTVVRYLMTNLVDSVYLFVILNEIKKIGKLFQLHFLLRLKWFEKGR